MEENVVIWEGKSKRVKVLYDREKNKFVIWIWKYQTNEEKKTDKMKEFIGRISTFVERERKKAIEVFNNLNALNDGKLILDYEHITTIIARK